MCLKSNFYRQIRNLNIDIQGASQTANIACIHYQVAQATSIMNVALVASTNQGTTQRGICEEPRVR